MWKVIDGQLVDLSKIFNITKVNDDRIQLISSNGNKYVTCEFEDINQRDAAYEKLKLILNAEEL